MKFSSCLAACAGAILAGSAGTSHADADTFVYEIVAGWTVRTDRARNFSCSMEARYEGGSVIRLGFDASGDGIRLVIGDSSWASVEVGGAYTADVAIGDEAPWASEASGVVIDEDVGLRGLRLDLSPSRATDVLRRLMREYSVGVSYDGREPLDLSLGGSYRAGLKLKECQAEMAEFRERSAPASDTGASSSTLSAGR